MRRRFVLICAFFSVVAQARSQHFRAQIISTVQGGSFWARSLNDSNVWGGFIRSSSGAETGYIGNFGLAVHTGALAGGRSYVNCVGNGKWSVGSSFDANGTERAFLFWDNYLEDLSFFQPAGYGASAATSVDDSGRVAGWITSPNGQKRTFTYYQGHFKTLPDFDDSNEPVAIWGNYVAGNSISNGLQRAFFWADHNQSVTYLPTFGGSSSAVYAMAIWSLVGEAETGSGAKQAFLWNHTQPFSLNLGTLGGANSKALGVNHAGHVVGQSEDSQGRRRAFLHRKGTLYDLNNLIDQRQPLLLTSAFAINNSGRILAEGASAGESVQVLLTPQDPFIDVPKFENESFRLHERSSGVLHFYFTVSGPTGSNYVFQISTNLVDWEDRIAPLPFSESSGTPITETAIYGPGRFWRIKMEP